MIFNNFLSSYRLKTRAQFDAVFQNARRFSGPSFVLYCAPNQLAHARLGIIVSKKRISLAVRRNRVKRLIREIFRCHEQVRQGYDLVFVSKQDAGRLDSGQQRQCVLSLLDKAFR